MGEAKQLNTVPPVGPSRLPAIMARLIERCRTDMVLAAGLADYEAPSIGELSHATAGCTSFDLGAVPDVVSALIGQGDDMDLRVDLFVGHLVATLVDFDVSGHCVREAVRSVAAWREHRPVRAAA